MTSLLSKSQLDDGNPNLAQNLTETQLDLLRLTNAFFIIETCTELQLRSETVSVALMQTHLFFLRKSYLNFDRALVCCASIFIACKVLYEKVNINNLCIKYFQTKHKGGVCPPIGEEERKKIIDTIYRLECEILRLLDFKLDLELFLPWPEYTCRFSQLLYEPIEGKGKSETVSKLAFQICNDAFVTYIPLTNTIQTVALAAVLLAATKLNFPVPSEKPDIFKYDDFFRAHQRRNPAADIQKYQNQFWVHKIDERIDEESLFECIQQLTELYEQIAKKSWVQLSLNSQS